MIQKKVLAVRSAGFGTKIAFFFSVVLASLALFLLAKATGLILSDANILSVSNIEKEAFVASEAAGPREDNGAVSAPPSADELSFPQVKPELNVAPNPVYHTPAFAMQLANRHQALSSAQKIGAEVFGDEAIDQSGPDSAGPVDFSHDRRPSMAFRSQFPPEQGASLDSLHPDDFESLHPDIILSLIPIEEITAKIEELLEKSAPDYSQIYTGLTQRLLSEQGPGKSGSFEKHLLVYESAVRVGRYFGVEKMADLERLEKQGKETLEKLLLDRGNVPSQTLISRWTSAISELTFHIKSLKFAAAGRYVVVASGNEQNPDSQGSPLDYASSW